MLARVKTSALSGIDAAPVEVEVEVGRGPQRFILVGLGDAAVKEARERVAAAIQICGFKFPEQVLVNLAPAELKKEGSYFDLPIAVGILVAIGIVEGAAVEHRTFHGELGLDGSLKPVRGAVARTITSRQMACDQIVVPAQNVAEARLVPGVRAIGAASLADVIRLCRGEELLYSPPKADENLGALQAERLSLDDVKGQCVAKRALTIAAAGGHHLLMVGPPGCGKSMLAARVPSLLSPLQGDELLEVAKVHSVASLDVRPILSGQRPVRSPHHSISENALVGGGPMPRPGEISLAHRGVLFLDEFPEFRRAAIEALRTPLETRRVTVSRVKQVVEFPAHFQLIAAMNPCPCGRLGAGAQSACLCSRAALRNYLAKLSRPILDRIDIQVELQAVTFDELQGVPNAKRDCRRSDVVRAQELQRARQFVLNAELAPPLLNRYAVCDAKALSLLERATDRLGLSARGCIRVMRVARTIADLAGDTDICAPHVAEALAFRALERIEQFMAPASKWATRSGGY